MTSEIKNINQDNSNTNELLIKLDDFIRKYYKNRLLRGAIFFIGGVLSFFLLVSINQDREPLERFSPNR